MRSMILLLLMAFTLPALAQEEKQHIRKGNKLYQARKYQEAEKSYREALEKKKDSYKAIFNLGDAYYKQGKYKEAAGQFEMLLGRKTGKDTLAMVYHNLGNSLLMQQQYDKSIAAYKNALRNDPTDEDTRYNLAYAQMMQQMQQQQQQNQQQQDQQNKDNKKQDDKNKDNQDKGDKNKPKEKEGDKGDENKEKNDQQDQQRPKQQQQISQEDAQRLLDALNNDEKDIQKKLKKAQSKGKSPTDKDW